MKSWGDEYLRSLFAAISSVDWESLEKVTKKLQAFTRNPKKKVYLLANGGSNAVVSHVAIDLLKVHKISAFAANDSTVITCFSNDYGHHEWMSEFVLNHGTHDDLFILVSSSGSSRNIINAASRCEELGFDLVTLSGFDEKNPLRDYGTVSMWVNSADFNVVENTHQVWLLAICDYLKILNP